MDRRTKDQCYQRYMNSLRSVLRKGYFSDAEDFMILIGYKLFGPNWGEIANYMPSRTAMQIHSRYNTFLRTDFQEWDEDDDQKLLQLVKEHGSKDWVKIANQLEGKNRTQCRNRFQLIYKAYVRDQEQFHLNKLKNSSLQRKRQRTLYTRLEDKLGEFLEAQKEARLEENAEGFRKVDLQGFYTTADGVSKLN